MKRLILCASAGLVLWGLESCSPSAVTYYKVGAGQSSPLSGTDCPGAGPSVITLNGIDGAGTIAVYSQPSNAFVVDLGALALLENPVAGKNVELTGTVSGGVYSFSGDWVQNDQGTPAVQTQVNARLNFTPSGPGMTGTMTFEYICNSTSGSDCGAGNPLDAIAGVSSSDGKNFDCVSTNSLVGSTVPAPQEIEGNAAGVSP